MRALRSNAADPNQSPRRVKRMLMSIAIIAALAGVGPPLKGVCTPVPPMEVQSVDIVGPTRIGRNRLGVYSISGLKKGSVVFWDVSPRAGVDRVTIDGRLVLTGTPGSYIVSAKVVTIVDGALQASDSELAMTIEGEAAPAPPAPPPAPKTPPKEGPPSAAIHRIQFGSSGCTASVIRPRRADGTWDILTAEHCLPERRTIGTLIETGTGRRIQVRVMTRDALSDVAWLRTTEAVEFSASLPLADREARPGEKIWHQGFGVDKPGNREEGVASGFINSRGKAQYVLSVSSGDSGGPILSVEDNVVFSPVCCSTNVGGRGTMFGGSAARCRELRPK